MYSGTHGHHGGGGGGGFRLYLQRFLCSYRSFVVIFVVFLFIIFTYYYNDTVTLLRAREFEANRCQQKLDSISAQLQVVYEHKSRLEKSLSADKEACTKRIEGVNKDLKTAKDGLDKSQAELKALQKQQAALQKQVTDLKAEKDTAEKIASKLSVDAAKVKDQYAKETETYKGENTRLNALVLQLQTALNKSLDQIASLQQQLASLQQQSQAGVQLQPSYNAAAAKEPVQLLTNQLQQIIPGGTQPSILAPPLVNGTIQSPAAGGQVPQGNAALPVRAQTAVIQPQPEQVALPMAERQQQQLIAQQQVPLQQQQQQQPIGQQVPPAPVLQQPLGEGQQQLLMVRPNAPNANAKAVPQAPAVVQAPPPAPFPQAKGQPLQQQAPPPVPAQSNSSYWLPAPVQDADAGAGAGAIYHDIEQIGRQLDPNIRAADDYRDDEEDNRHKDFDDR